MSLKIARTGGNNTPTILPSSGGPGSISWLVSYTFLQHMHDLSRLTAIQEEEHTVK